MQLDREDDVPPGSTLAPTAIDNPPLSNPAAWFAGPAVPVVVKKRRALDASLLGSGSDAARAGPNEADERRPRVFVLPKETSATEDAPPPAAAEAAVQPPPRRRRRRLPEQRPSPVVLIVPERTEPAPAPADTEADDGFVLELPSLQGWRDVQTALAGVRRLVQDAEHASLWALAPAPRARRSRRG